MNKFPKPNKLVKFLCLLSFTLLWLSTYINLENSIDLSLTEVGVSLTEVGVSLTELGVYLVIGVLALISLSGYKKTRKIKRDLVVFGTLFCILTISLFYSLIQHII